MQNDGTVFSAVKLTSLLEKLIYSDTYPIIDQDLSPSNVGSCEGRNTDQLFIIYCMIYDFKNGKAKDIDIQGYDIYNCFDKMNYEETYNDL